MYLAQLKGFAVISALIMAMTGVTHHHKTHRARCVAGILAQETITGHEADRPVTFCGHGHMPPEGTTCYVTPWGQYVPGSALECGGRVYRHLVIG